MLKKVCKFAASMRLIASQGDVASDNSVFPLTGRGVQRSGFEEESGFMMLIQGANS
jgi:hypothetical protein